MYIHVNQNHHVGMIPSKKLKHISQKYANHQQPPSISLLQPSMLIPHALSTCGTAGAMAPKAAAGAAAFLGLAVFTWSLKNKNMGKPCHISKNIRNPRPLDQNWVKLLVYDLNFKYSICPRWIQAMVQKLVDVIIQWSIYEDLPYWDSEHCDFWKKNTSNSCNACPSMSPGCNLQYHHLPL